MNLDHAKYFVVLSETQHIQKAALILGISSTAISHGIAKLEDELGVELTTKVGRNIILTEKGLSFVNMMKPILENIKDIKEEISDSAISGGLYKFAVTHGLFSIVSMNNFLKSLSTYGNVSLEISSKRSSEVMKCVVDGLVDMGICFSPMKHPSLESKILYQGNLVFCAKKTHAIFKRNLTQKLTLMNSLGAVGIKASQGVDNCESHPVFKKLNISPRYDFVVDSYELQLDILKQSDSWGFLPELFVKQNQDWLKKIDLGRVDAKYTLEALWNKNRPPMKLYKQLIEEMMF